MIINSSKVKSQIKEVDMYISKLHESKKEINNYKVDLNNNWIAYEMNYFNGAIEKILRELDKAVYILDSLKNEMQKELEKIKK